MATADIVEYCAVEVQRQMASPMHVAGMYRAWEIAVFLVDQGTGPVTGEKLILLNDLVLCSTHRIGYRQTPVSFRDGGTAADWWEVPHLMERLLSFQHEATPDEFTKQFLDIHPFADGNGRVGSLLWNILSGTIKSPVRMPNYYDGSG